mmetsp:Transcript_9160/g.19838  ORF Transcript_9160/g.19838 Transcript_9160/m.19838 type:complete len:284 (+) Transcript_9160:523-1374(+)
MRRSSAASVSPRAAPLLLCGVPVRFAVVVVGVVSVVLLKVDLVQRLARRLLVALDLLQDAELALSEASERTAQHDGEHHTDRDQKAGEVLAEDDGLLHKRNLLGFEDDRELRELGLQVGVAVPPDLRGLGPLAVARVDAREEAHAAHDPAKGHEALGVEHVVVVEVEDELRAAAVRARSVERERAAHVPVRVFDAHFVGNVPTSVPVVLQRGVWADTKLGEEAWHNSVKCSSVKEAGVYQLAKPTSPNRGFGLSYCDHNLSNMSRLKLHCKLNSEVVTVCTVK